MDYRALGDAIPWKDPECHSAASLHLGDSAEEIEAAERAAWHGKHTDRPFVLLAQPSLFDTTRAPQGQHTAWAYCHVPNGSTQDMTEVIETQVERFALWLSRANPGSAHDEYGAIGKAQPEYLSEATSRVVRTTCGSFCSVP